MARGIVKLLKESYQQLKLHYYSIDLYFEQVNALIKYHLVPFFSVDDLKAGRVNPLAGLKIGFYFGTLLVNLFRFTLIALSEEAPFVRAYFYFAFAQSPNHSLLYLTTVLGLLAPTFMCNIFYEFKNLWILIFF